MRNFFTFLFFILTFSTYSQTAVRIGVGSGNCGTTSNPCPTTLCTSSSTNATPLNISLPSGSRISFSFDQDGGCGGSYGYQFETSEKLTLTITGFLTTDLYVGSSSGGTTPDGAEATGSGCYFNNTASAVTLSFSVNANRRDEAVILTYTVATGDDTCIPLPINLKTFDVVKSQDSQNKSLITFSTASETNNDYFTIERSADGIDFDIIGEMKGAGNSNQVLNYEFVDEKPMTGINYYRLKQTDFDGKFTYSDIKSVRFSTLGQVTITPRTTAGRLDITTDTRDYDVAIFNAGGQEIKSFKSLSLDQTINIDELKSGIYFVKINNGSDIETTRIVKL